MIGLFPLSCLIAAASIPTQQENDMIQDVKRYRAMRWMVINDMSTDERIAKIIDTVPQIADDVGDNPTITQIDAAFDAAIAHLEANGIDLSGAT